MKRIKDTQYWKEYNSKRREYNRLKQQEYRKRIKEVAGIVADQSIARVADNQPKKQVADTLQNQKVADKTSQLWSDYYSVKKPFCQSCNQQSISEKEYKFCSLKKEPPNFYFKNIYLCQVYHWNIYQGRMNP